MLWVKHLIYGAIAFPSASTLRIIFTNMLNKYAERYGQILVYPESRARINSLAGYLGLRNGWGDRYR